MTPYEPSNLPEPAVARSTEADDAAAFADLLRRRASGPEPAASPSPGQVLLARLLALPVASQSGEAEVPALGRLAVAHSLVPLLPEHLGQQVALSLLAPGQALVLGLLWGGETPAAPQAPALAHEPLSLTVDGHREVIEGAQELELRCGEAAIVLTADGRIQLRGTYITSHASATQRIVGGSVHVN